MVDICPEQSIDPPDSPNEDISSDLESWMEPLKLSFDSEECKEGSDRPLMSPRASLSVAATAKVPPTVPKINLSRCCSHHIAPRYSNSNDPPRSELNFRYLTEAIKNAADVVPIKDVRPRKTQVILTENECA